MTSLLEDLVGQPTEEVSCVAWDSFGVAVFQELGIDARGPSILRLTRPHIGHPRVKGSGGVPQRVRVEHASPFGTSFFSKISRCTSLGQEVLLHECSISYLVWRFTSLECEAHTQPDSTLERYSLAQDAFHQTSPDQKETGIVEVDT